MALTANTLREGVAAAASAAGRRKEEGAPRKEEVSFLAVGDGSQWRDKVVVAMAVHCSLFCSALLSYLLICLSAGQRLEKALPK
jgi:hypothetical protein